MKILNLYAGIGGNRKLWGESHEVTAVELNPNIAKIYTDFFPNDKMIVTDAHEYLLEHFKEYDFIWSSPPCQTHTAIRKNFAYAKGPQRREVKYIDMSLYQEIILLENFYKGKYCVENVTPYYKPLKEPTAKLGRHLIWTNFNTGSIKQESGDSILRGGGKLMAEKTGFDLSKYKIGYRKDTVLNNCVLPEHGLYILNCALNIITKHNPKQDYLF